MGNYSFGSINSISRTSLRSQSNSAGLIIPQIAYLGNASEIRSQNFTNSRILNECLFLNRSFLQKRKLNVSGSNSVTKTKFFDLSDVYSGVSHYKNLYNGSLIRFYSGRKLLNVGLALVLNPGTGKINETISFDEIYNLQNPEFDLTVLSNVNSDIYMSCLFSMPLSLKQVFKVQQPQNVNDKDNASIQILNTEFFLNRQPNDDRRSGIFIRNQQRPTLSYDYGDHGVHRLKGSAENNLSGGQLKLIIGDLYDRGRLPRRLLNLQNIENLQNRKYSFVTLTDLFTKKYINTLFYITYEEIFRTVYPFSEFFNDEENSYDLLVSYTLIGMILYGLRKHSFTFTDNKLYFLNSDSLNNVSEFEFGERELNGLTFSSFNRELNISNVNNQSKPILLYIKKIYNKPFVKDNLSLICKSITFIKELSSENISFNQDNFFDIIFNSRNALNSKDYERSIEDRQIYDGINDEFTADDPELLPELSPAELRVTPPEEQFDIEQKRELLIFLDEEIEFLDEEIEFLEAQFEETEEETHTPANLSLIASINSKRQLLDALVSLNERIERVSSNQKELDKLSVNFDEITASIDETRD